MKGMFAPPNYCPDVQNSKYMRPIVMYACETWSSTQGDKEKLQSFERKILRKIYGSVYNNDLERFERRTNENLWQFYKKPSLRTERGWNGQVMSGKPKAR